jgi:aspartate aminotransferase/aminotransferase
VDKYLAERTKVVDASGIRKIWALAASLSDPIDFSIGQPDFDVPDGIKTIAQKAIAEGQNKYTLTAGDSLLRRRIAEHLRDEFDWTEPEVLVTSGVSGGLLLAFMALINPGDEVIIPDPYFVIYKHIIAMLGGRSVFVDSYPDFDLPIHRIAEAIGPKTKMIIVNSPCNPTGRAYSPQQLQTLAKIAAEKQILVLSDEIYDKFCYDRPHSSIASYYDRTILLRGFSKSYGMPGWRLGYAAAREPIKEIIEQMTKIQQYTFVCAPRPLQMAAIEALDYDINDLINSYREKRNMVYAGLRDKFELVRPEGAFYAFLRAPGDSASQFVEKAIKNNVLVIPGSVFSEKDTHFRISYTTSNEKIEQGVEILRKLA